MPKKKTKTEDLAELTETTDPVETTEQADAPEQTDAPEPEAESIPTEAEENFGLTDEGDGTGEEPADDISEPDIEHAPDFWSDAVDVSTAEEPSAEGDAAGILATPESEPLKDDPQAPVDTQSEDNTPSHAMERVPTSPGLMAKGAERRAFFGLDFHELDRSLSQQERQEWNAIYASFRGHSVMSGKVAGANPHTFCIRDRRTGEILTRKFLCAVVIPFRVPILIPETELWFRGEERPRNVTRNIGGSTIDFVITKVDREKSFVMASRRLALISRRYYFSTQPQLNRLDSRTECSVLTVGNRRMLVSCHGYDITLTQRELDYTAIPDLKERYRRGQVLDCLVKEYNSRQNHLVISVKETIPNPYDGADFRHPEGCSRQAIISGKYGGGVFCNLTDGVTVMCNYSFQYEDIDFLIGDSVTVVIQRFDSEKKQIFGKIVARE